MLLRTNETWPKETARSLDQNTRGTEIMCCTFVHLIIFEKMRRSVILDRQVMLDAVETTVTSVLSLCNAKREGLSHCRNAIARSRLGGGFSGISRFSEE